MLKACPWKFKIPKRAGFHILLVFLFFKISINFELSTELGRYRHIFNFLLISFVPLKKVRKITILLSFFKTIVVNSYSCALFSFPQLNRNYVAKSHLHHCKLKCQPLVGSVISNARMNSWNLIHFSTKHERLWNFTKKIEAFGHQPQRIASIQLENSNEFSHAWLQHPLKCRFHFLHLKCDIDGSCQSFLYNFWAIEIGPLFGYHRSPPNEIIRSNWQHWKTHQRK